MKTLRIGIFGAGTVGSGVIEILESQKQAAAAQGISLEIKKCCVRDTKKYKDKIPSHIKLVTDIEDIIKDPEIDLVLELIGGATVAKTIVISALKAGKHVITANKALIAQELETIESTLKAYPHCYFGYEAAVAGGIPIIHSLQNDFALDNITEISGILNGTTNFILSKMEVEGLEYKTVLKEAQKKGYAEADPTDDVKGFDARAKLIILIRLAFGYHVKADTIYTQGIESLTDTDFAYAKSLKRKIKLIAFAQKKEGVLSTFVAPVLVPKDDPIAYINGATNAVRVGSEFLDKTTFVGQGAGKFPTANAVVSDCYQLLRNKRMQAFPPTKDLINDSGVAAQYYVRFQVKDAIGVLRSIGAVCEKYGISIHSISQLPIGDENNLPFVLTTEKTLRPAVEYMINEVAGHDYCNESPFFMRLL